VAEIYIHNRTPRYTYNWKPSYDAIHTHIIHRDGVGINPAGYDSTNNFRIWNNKGFRSRDVMFNEDEIYERKGESPDMMLTELHELINTMEKPDQSNVGRDFQIVIPMF
jgi:hypothetical protein